MPAILRRTRRADAGLARAYSYYLLIRALIAAPGQTGTIAEALRNDTKGRISPWIYAAGIPIALVAPYVSFAMYVGVAAMWIIPDPRIERRIST